jgi:hypothetical protein
MSAGGAPGGSGAESRCASLMTMHPVGTIILS